jgi:protein O-GlcNAc transferase
MKSNQRLEEQFASALNAHQSAQVQLSENLCREILGQFGNHPPTLHLLGIACARQNRLDEAVTYIQNAVQHEPQPIYLNDLANILKKQGKISAARDFYLQSIKLYPGYFQAYTGLGNLFLEQADYDSAMNYYQQSLTLNDIDAAVYNNMGIISGRRAMWQEAVNYFQKVTQLRPDLIFSWYNLAMTYERLAETEKARQCYQKVLELEPGNILLGLYTETLEPPVVLSNQEIDIYQKELLLTIEKYIAMDLHTDLNTLYESGLKIPLALYYQFRDDRHIRERYAAIFRNCFPAEGRKHYAPAKSFSFPRNPKPRIGFIVTHRHEMVFMTWMEGIINRLSTEKFEITIICNQINGENIIKPRIKNPLIRYLSLTAEISRDIETIRNEKFDLLYYWEVGTDTTNYFLPFSALAPVQCSSFGWPVTSGIPDMDYHISSELLETPESDNYYSEKLIRLKTLPTYYFKGPLPETFMPRSHYGLSDQQHIYLCTQNLRKIHPDFDSITFEILQRDPKAIYLLFEDREPAITALLKNRLEITHPDVKGRIRFLPRMARGSDYINMLKLADLVIDPVHYGGWNTSYDAYTVGTPVITLPGQFSRGRYTYATYQKMGIMDCIVDSPDDYIKLAVAIATNPDYRNEISNKINERSDILFEDQQAVSELSDLFEKLIYG